MVSIAPTRTKAAAFCSSDDKISRAWSAVVMSSWEVGWRRISVRIEVMSKWGIDWIVTSEGCWGIVMVVTGQVGWTGNEEGCSCIKDRITSTEGCWEIVLGENRPFDCNGSGGNCCC